MSGHHSTLHAAALVVTAFGAAVGPATTVGQQSTRPLDLASFPRTTLQITHRAADHATRTYPFTVWVADTPERAEQGLMFVSDLPDTLGMVFPMEPPRIASFWMKNTYIELDMLFIGADGRVAKITQHAVPMSLQPLSSDTPVAAVLELRGGLAEKLGLRPGDTVVWKKPAN
jgi:uncharacterized membrane protein (UPF0127 family)